LLAGVAWQAERLCRREHVDLSTKE